jgi:hypothetical protein
MTSYVPMIRLIIHLIILIIIIINHDKKKNEHNQIVSRMAEQDSKEYVTKFNTDYPEMLLPDGKHKLADNWVIWSHEPHSINPAWTLDGYRKHCTISTVEGFWEIFNGLPSMINEDMWFLMREGIPPRWEDPVNKEGGSFKFRVGGDKSDNTWLTLAITLVTENMCMHQQDATLISGISLSPKRGNFCTISVWNLDRFHTEHAKFPKNIKGINFEMSRYEAHDERRCG